MLRAILPLLIVAAPLAAQELEKQPLLPWNRFRAVVNEVSGDRALNCLKDMIPYMRVRDRKELAVGPYRETEVLARWAREAGFSEVKVESIPESGSGRRGGGNWSPTRAELWLAGPNPVKLYDAFDMALSVASRSENGDITAELVAVGRGDRPEHYAGKEVAGKIVVGTGSLGQMQRLAVLERGALGVLSASSSHPELDPLQQGSQGLGTAPEGKKPGFGWSISTTLARDLSERLARGEKLSIRSVIEGETFPSRSEWVYARLDGDGSTNQDLLVTGHLYEGITKMGVNDDASGCAVGLEMGRALARLVKEGALPKLKRTVHFLWVPEISGSMAWLQKNPDIGKRLIANLNFDMEGIALASNASFWTLHRTPDTRPSFLNDVAENLMQVAAAANREPIEGGQWTLPILSPNGTKDPFHIQISKYFGSSDHIVFLGAGIPSVMFITWPDPYYHTSHDTTERQDPTQLKRVGVVGAATLSVLGSAGDPEALAIAADSLGRGLGRVSQAQRKGLGYLTNLQDAAGFATAHKEARNAVRHQIEVEKAVLKSTGTLMKDGGTSLVPLVQSLDARATALQTEVDAYARLTAVRLGATYAVPVVTDLEKKAAKLVVERIPREGGRGSFFGGGAPNLPRLPGGMSGEFNNLADQKRTVLDIRNFLSGEFQPVPLEQVMAYAEALEKAGQVKLVPLTR